VQRQEQQSQTHVEKKPLADDALIPRKAVGDSAACGLVGLLHKGNRYVRNVRHLGMARKPSYVSLEQLLFSQTEVVPTKQRQWPEQSTVANKRAFVDFKTWTWAAGLPDQPLRLGTSQHSFPRNRHSGRN
jgi:hypothetical protein